MKDKNSIKIHEFDPVIYPMKLWITTDTSGIGSNLYEWLDEDGNTGEISPINHSAIADTDMVVSRINSDIGIMIRFRSRKDMQTKTITHESIHGALFIFRHLGIVPSVNNQEPLTYLAEWIAECCDIIKKGKYEEDANE